MLCSKQFKPEVNIEHVPGLRGVSLDHGAPCIIESFRVLLIDALRLLQPTRFCLSISKHASLAKLPETILLGEEALGNPRKGNYFCLFVFVCLILFVSVPFLLGKDLAT